MPPLIITKVNTIWVLRQIFSTYLKYDYFPSFQFNVEFSQLSRIRIRGNPAIFISALKVILSAALQLMKLFHFNVRNPKPGVYIVSSAPPTPLTPPFPLGVIYSDKDHLVKILF